ncbi:MAG: nucleotidyltransferase family protein [Candidatus Aenigmatarchaeota archaeon]
MKRNMLNELKKKILPILKNYDVIKAGIFGSFARGEANKKSDIDLLVKFKGRKSLLDLISLEIALKNKLKRKVEVLTYDSLHPLLKERILKEEIRIHEEKY